MTGAWTWTLPSAVGPLTAVADGEGALTALRFGPQATEEGRSDPAPFAPLQEWLDAWSQRRPIARAFPLAPPGTAFQVQVWDALETIAFGRTSTYGALALGLGGATKTRAVGRANGSNPIALVVPCHRVIGSDGSLVGYAGGVDMKRRLLVHEGALLL